MAVNQARYSDGLPTLKTLLLRQQSLQRTLFPQPSERPLWTIEISATTLGTLPRPGGMMEESSRPEFSVHISQEQATTQATGSELEPLPIESNIDVALLSDKLDLLTADPILVQREYTVGKNGDIGSKLGCNLEWLTREDAEAAMYNKIVYIIDAESLDDGVPIPVSNLRGSMYRHGQELAQIGNQELKLEADHKI
ncbi:hypothetical protein QQS21_011428, partial [Conoideocrella luteorostrata]